MSCVRRPRLQVITSLAIVVLVVAAAPVGAQENIPIGPFVVDLRGAFAAYGTNLEVASARGLAIQQLPALGLGVDVAAHWYPVRWGAITFGLGAQVLASRAKRSPTLDDVNPGGPTIQTRFTSVSPQLSFNFGGTSGWSYISGGLGSSKFSVVAEPDEPETPAFSTLNYGGGGRWFARQHLAFSFDLRFYAISPQEQREDFVGLPRMTLFVFSLGASFR